MKRTVILIILLALPALAARAADIPPDKAAELFQQANGHYEAGRYGKAIETYDLMLAGGLKSGALYYNLGNACLKSGELGRAVLSYERAKRYMPGDSDLLSNYMYAKGLMKQQDMPEKRHLALRWLDRALSYLTLGQSVLLVTALYYLLVIIFIITRVFGMMRRQSTMPILALLTLIILLLFPVSHKIMELESGGVVVKGITDARLEPSEEAPVNFPLYGGMKVYVLRQREGWTRVKRPDGKIGWVEGGGVEVIGG